MNSLFGYFKNKRRQKRQAEEYYSMLYSIRNMYAMTIPLDTFVPHLRKATDAEVEQLINDSKTITPEVPGPGYYIPDYRNFITYSLEKWPDMVYFFQGFGVPDAQRWDELSIRAGNIFPLPQNYMNKELVVFLFDDFGLSETYLCAREGYVFYDADELAIVAYSWRFES